MKKFLFLTQTVALIGIFGVIGLAQQVAAEEQAVAEPVGIPTKIMVRAVSRDAKVIGTNVGAARITITDVDTGAVLAEGLTLGGAGSTAKLIVEPRKRGESIYDTQGAAGFLATLNLDRPKMVEITAVGPLGDEQGNQKASKTMLLVPGQDILGDGVLLEIHGFTLKLIRVDEVSGKVGVPYRVRVNLTMT